MCQLAPEKCTSVVDDLWDHLKTLVASAAASLRLFLLAFVPTVSLPLENKDSETEQHPHPLLPDSSHPHRPALMLLVSCCISGAALERADVLITMSSCINGAFSKHGSTGNCHNDSSGLKKGVVFTPKQALDGLSSRGRRGRK